MSEEKTHQGKTIGIFNNLVLGGISGSIASTLLRPIQRVKVIFSLQSQSPPKYTGLANCFYRVYHEHGLKEFWRGNLTPAIRNFTIHGLNFTIKDSLKQIFPIYNSKTEFGKFIFVQMASGALAGAGAHCILEARKTIPIDFNIFHIYNEYRISLVRAIVYRGVYFGLFDSLIEKSPYKRDKGMMGILSTCIVAQFTAILAGYASYPFDTIHRRFQMESEKPKERKLYKGILDCAKKIISKEGKGALFKGMGAIPFRAVESAIVLVLYYQFQKMKDIEG
jgi:solute carrier family 25 (mitochondrial adenine nucleotide translocator), member 4/5/6/31